jgi:hypothetical protein
MINKLSAGPADQRISNTFRVMYRRVSNVYSPAGILLTKFIGKVENSMQVYNTDFPIYRYAEVLLMLAEAKAKLGEDPSADINLVRQRAYGSGYTPYTDGTLAQDMTAILEENLKEFIGEGKRWFTLRRAGNSYVYQYVNPVYLDPTKPHLLLLPISIGMTNLDPKLEQTTGY